MNENLNTIGLDTNQAGELSDKLNTLLCNYQVYYMNIRGLHWNIKGNMFFELHAKFEELYNGLFLKIDEIAERILTLGHTPFHSFSDFKKKAELEERLNVTEAKASVEVVLEGLQTLIKLQREIQIMAADTNDEGTNAMMSDYIREQEKLAWMYNAFLG